MAYSLRLPDALDAAARGRADYLGISLNALVCVALDAYLRQPSGPPGPHGQPPDIAPANRPDPASQPSPEPTGGTAAPSKTSRQQPAANPSGLTKKQRHEAYKAEQDAKRAEFKRLHG